MVFSRSLALKNYYTYVIVMLKKAKMSMRKGENPTLKKCIGNSHSR